MADVANKKYYSFERIPGKSSSFPPSNDDTPPTVNPPDSNPVFNQALGVKLNKKTIGGVKRVIEQNDYLEVPVFWQYNVRASALINDGIIDNDGEINID